MPHRLKVKPPGFLAIFLGFFAIPAAAATHYVDANSSNPTSPYTDWNTAATDIQDAIDAATNGDLVLVTNGIYQTGGRAIYGAATNRVTVDKAVTVQSVNGAGSTIIAGTGDRATPGIRCVYLTNGAALIGFTLTGAATRFAGDVVNEQSGGGVWCEDNSAIVSNCVIVDDYANQYGGAAYRGTLFNCILTNNIAISGGAGACSNNLFNCILTQNFASFGGGGAIYSTLSNCLLVANSVSYGSSGGGAAFSILTSCVVSNNSAPYGNGGGVYFGTINNSIICSNSAAQGGGAFSNVLNNCILQNNSATHSDGGAGGGAYGSTLMNCTVVSNYADAWGGGTYWCNVINSVVYYNSSPKSPNYQIYQTTTPNFCCTTPLPASGIGNITNEPIFVDSVNGDFHLQSNSPCINSGNNAYVTVTNDLDGNPRIVAGTVDMGCYEYQTPTSIISYAWLQQNGLPTDGSVDYADLDGTGFNVYQDWVAGLNPTNSASVLALFTPTAINNASGIEVIWQSVNGIFYNLQRSTNLPVFVTIATNLYTPSSTASYTDTSATNNVPYFYRVGVIAP